MEEKVIQKMWVGKMFHPHNWHSVLGNRIDIIDFGKLNTDFGPDISKARILINGVEWSGNIEIHINGNEWKKHGHSNQIEYSSTILHVCVNNATPIQFANSKQIDAINISSKYSDENITHLASIISQYAEFPCNSILNLIPNEIKINLSQTNANNYFIQSGIQWLNQWKAGVSIPQIRFVEWVQNIGRGPSKLIWKEWAKTFPLLEVCTNSNNHPLQIEFEDFNTFNFWVEGKFGIEIQSLHIPPQRARKGRRPQDLIKQIQGIINHYPDIFFEPKIQTAPTRPFQFSTYSWMHWLQNVVPKEIAFNYVQNGIPEFILETLINHFNSFKPERDSIVKSNFPFKSYTNWESKSQIAYLKEFCIEKKCVNCVYLKHHLNSKLCSNEL